MEENKMKKHDTAEEKAFDILARDKYQTLIHKLEHNNYKVIGNNFFRDYYDPMFSYGHDMVCNLIVFYARPYCRASPDNVIEAAQVDGFDVGISSMVTMQDGKRMHVDVSKKNAKINDLIYAKDMENVRTQPQDSLYTVVTGIHKEMFDGQDCKFNLFLPSEEFMRKYPSEVKEILNGGYSIYTPVERAKRYFSKK